MIKKHLKNTLFLGGGTLGGRYVRLTSHETATDHESLKCMGYVSLKQKDNIPTLFAGKIISLLNLIFAFTNTVRKSTCTILVNGHAT